MNNLNKKKIIFLIFSVFLIMVYLVFTVLLFRNTQTSDIPTRSKPLPKTLEEEYSNLNKLIPGKNTVNDVIKTNGYPQDTLSENGKTYLYYNTPFEELNNVVLIENNVVTYAHEWIFGNQRGTYDKNSSPLGPPGLILYSEDAFDLPWFAFPEKGTMIRVSDVVITEAVYFVPQDKESFLKSVVVSDLEISEKIPEGEPFGP